MASYEILKNQPLVVNLPTDYAVQGWEVSENKGYHSGCNSGYMDRVFDLSAATEWTFKYRVIEYTSGSVNLVVNGLIGTSHTSVGEFTDTFTVTGANRLVRFFSTGKNAVEVLQIYPNLDYEEGTTLAFNEDADKWVTYYSYDPERMNKFKSSFFTFKNGGLWEHNVNETRNNFYGIQSSSKVSFVFNFEFRKNKLVFNFRLDSKGAWFIPNMETDKNDQFPNGMKSRLKKNNFKSIDGKLWASVLRDLTDPAFAGISDPNTRALEALFKGRKMQCGSMLVEMQNNDTTEAKLASVEVYYIEAERNF